MSTPPPRRWLPPYLRKQQIGRILSFCTTSWSYMHLHLSTSCSGYNHSLVATCRVRTLLKLFEPTYSTCSGRIFPRAMGPSWIWSCPSPLRYHGLTFLSPASIFRPQLYSEIRLLSGTIMREKPFTKGESHTGTSRPSSLRKKCHPFSSLAGVLVSFFFPLLFFIALRAELAAWICAQERTVRELFGIGSRLSDLFRR